MIKRSFIGLYQARLTYDAVDPGVQKARAVRPRQSVRLLVECPMPPGKKLLLATGDKVKEGQKLLLSNNSSCYAIATAAGIISAIEPHTGNFGRKYTAVTITLDPASGTDDSFRTECGQPSMKVLRDFLAHLPGTLPPALLPPLAGNRPELHTLVVLGMDSDLLVNTRRHILQSGTAAVKTGVRLLKQITGIQKIILAVPDALSQEALSVGEPVQTLSAAYPSALPRLIVKSISGNPVPASKTCEEAGFCFVSVETAAALGSAFETGVIPKEKRLTIVDKQGRKTMISAVIGTSIKDILDDLHISLNEGDRLINGGPMTGEALQSEFHPVCPDMDAICIQDKNAIPLVENSYCINCGECIRICPVNVPVNLLVRYLEAGRYDEARDRQDLDACIECGLCSYVCTARIPIFQYIRQAKFELAGVHPAEAGNA
ncbi:MAG: 4Fe-4S binding protein [Thermodesulfobacteriota bacterium]